MEGQRIKHRPRGAAIRVLGQVLSQGEPLDRAIDNVAHEVPADSAAWFQDVCSGTLRWKGRLELAIDSLALKKKPTGWLRRALMIGVYQLIAQDKAAAAPVVSETVSEIRNKDGDAPAKFANALLRRVADHAAEWRVLPFPGDRTLEEQAAWASLSPWLWSRMVKSRGLEWSCAFAQACLQRPSIWLRSREGWSAPSGVSAGPLTNSWKVEQGGSVTAIAGFESGDWIVQDLSSQMLISEISHTIGSRGHALDLCASPGGKAVGLAWEGWKVSATDCDARLAVLRQTVQRTKAEVQVLEREAVDALPAQDLVWVDAPCTGSGIIRRHPDVRWLKQEKDLGSLQKLQRELLIEGWAKVKPGGALAYTVCSVLKEEGSDLVKGSPLEGSTVVKEWLLGPQEELGSDGFWGVLLRRQG